MIADKKLQYEVAVASLFHDIGKFKQRAFGGDENNLLQKTKGIEAVYLPSSKDDRFTHRHALWTFDFFHNEFKSVIDCSDNDFLYSINIEKIAKLAAIHHNPDNDSLSQIISIADRYSAGNDRSKDQSQYKPKDYLRKPLRSIFSSLHLWEDEWKIDKSRWTYSLKPIADSDSMFPLENVDISENEYRKQYDLFIDEMNKSIQMISSYELLLAKLKDLLYKYTWCIPSATNDYLNDISLYDHSVTTMAIAIALLNNDDGTDKISVCAFSVSGIQSFIFQSKFASFKNAAKIFRGRSFIVSAFSTAMKKLISERLGIIPFSDIRDAGGGMTLLLPDFDEIGAKLEEIQLECEKFLLLRYYGTLSFCLYYENGVSPECFGKGKYIDFNKRISKALSISKMHKFSHFVSQGVAPVLPLYKEKKICDACGKHGTESDLCEICESERVIGEKLPKGNLFIISSQYGDYEILPGYFLSVLKQSNASNASDSVWSLKKKEENCYPIWRLNNYTPDCDFCDIARNALSEDGTGKPFLAYIKIDVDNLGKLVSKGLPKSEYSISRFSTFSRSLHYFFNEYIHSLLEEEYSSVYTVLSGGDDLFVIAPWNKSLELIKRIKEDFRRFCCFNDELHFSAGVVIAKPKEPFTLVNSRANIALELYAKEYHEKNAISYFDTVFSLDELDAFIRDYKYLKSFFRTIPEDRTKPLTMGFLYRLYQYVSDRLMNTASERKYSVYAKLHYDIARNLLPEDASCSDTYFEVVDFILNRFDNYNSEKELEIFKLMLIQIMYEVRKTKQEDIECLLN